jgi:LacI family transcriptional regulator
MATNLRVIAAKAGVSVATASRALRGKGPVSGRAAERVRRAAEELGYSCSPLLGAMLSQVRRGRGASFVGTLAVVHVASAAQPRPVPFQLAVVEGARERARQLGFTLDLFEPFASALKPAALGRVLEARGIAGVILLHDHRDREMEGFPWERFALVELDYAAGRPALHTVCIDHHHTLGLALKRLATSGRRRAGLAIERYKDDRLDWRWSAAFFAQARRAGMESTEPMVMDKWDRAGFEAWIESERPDVVIGHRDEIAALLTGRGRRGPGFFSLNRNESRLGVAGLDLVPAAQGRAAVDAVVAQILRGERGPPAEPRTLMVAGRWTDGMKSLSE